MGGKGCKQVRLFLPDGNLFSSIRVRDEVHSLLFNDKLLAVEVHRHQADPFDLGVQSKPLRVTIYDLATKSENCSIRTAKAVSDAWGWSMFYALSPAGTVAVIQGNTLSLYQP